MNQEPTFKETPDKTCIGCAYEGEPVEDCLKHPCGEIGRSDNRNGIYVYPEVQTEEGE